MTATTSPAGDAAADRVKFPLLIFDFDGTLADTLPIIIECFRDVVSRHRGEPVSAEEVTSHFGLSEDGMMRKLVPDAWEACFTEFLTLYERSHDQVALFPGALDLLDHSAAQGHTLALVTGKGQTSAEISLRALKIEDRFRWIRTGDPTRDVKTDHIADILTLSGFSVTAALYVGDSASDMKAANAAGIAAAGACWHEGVDADALKAAGAMATFRTIAQFQDWLQGRA